MAVISSLFVKLSADSAELTKELNKTKRHARTWSDDVARYAKYGAAGFAAVAGAAALAAKSIYDSQAPIIDRFGKLSDSVDISVERLQSYRYAAGLAGISTQQLDSSVSKFNRRLGKAAEGGGAAAKAFKQLGIDAKELSSKGTDAAFNEVLDKLNQIEDRAVANGIAFDLFGQSATDIMRLSSEAINQASQEMAGFNGLISRVDAAKIEAANDAMYRVDQATEAVSRRLAVDMAPLLQATSELFYENVIQTDSFRNIGSTAMDVVASAVGWLGDRLQDLRTAFYALGTAGTAVGYGIVKVLNIVGVTSDETVKEWKGYLDDAINDVKESWNAENFSDALAEKIKQANEEAEKLKTTVNQIGKGDSLGIAGGGSGAGAPPPVSATGVSIKSDAPKAEEEGFSARILSFVEYREKLREEYSQLADIYRSDTQIAVDELNEKTAILGEYATLGDEEAIAARELEAQVRAEHEARITQIHQAEIDRRNRAREAERNLAIQTAQSTALGILSLLKSTSAAGDKESKKQFNRNKKISIAEAVVQGGVAVQRALSSAPPPYSYILAAVTAAKALKTVQQIRGTSYEGGGSLSAGGGGTSVPSETESATTAGSQTQTTERVETTANQEAPAGNIYVLYSGSGDLTNDDNDRIREQIRELADTQALKVSGSDIDDMRIEVV